MKISRILWEVRKMTGSDLGFLYAGYLIIWIGLFLYLMYLHLKQSSLENEIKNLSKLVKENDEVRKHGGKRKKSG